jgi:hypothetical protein
MFKDSYKEEIYFKNPLYGIYNTRVLFYEILLIKRKFRLTYPNNLTPLILSSFQFTLTKKL